jgi:formylglycine-generating enzyme required for sulfatase activity
MPKLVQASFLPTPTLWRDLRSSETAPATSVNWYDATAFCEWLSGLRSMHARLPSEAEWEFAARGGVEQQSSPWGLGARAHEVSRWRDGP